MQSFLTLSPEKQNTAVALGFFDGLHRGHRRVLSLAANEKCGGLVPVCLTFDESPKSIVTGEKIPSLMTREDKLSELEKLGIEHVYLADFRELMHLAPREFAEEILFKKLRAKKLFCGFNYRFGRNAEGDTELLTSLCKQFGAELTVIPPEKENGEVVSSTLIKKLISGGEIERANSLLCSRFGFTSVIEHGKRLGRELGTPTINQPLSEGLIVPKFGVYASVVTLENGDSFCGVTNVGIKPTVGGKTPLWETWMPDYHGGDIYGQTADVRLLAFIRPEKRFESLDALKNEIVKNSITAKEIYDRTALTNN